MVATPTRKVFQNMGNLSDTAKVEVYAMDLVDLLEEDYKRRYPNSSSPVKFEVESGRKYWKINQIDGGVHAFIDKKTGEVYKPASWRGPAEHVRYNLLDAGSRARLFLARPDWAGSYLYLR